MKALQTVSQEGANIRFNILGLTVLCVSLIIATGVMTYFFLHDSKGGPSLKKDMKAEAPAEGYIQAKDNPPWGELITSDITLNAPEEYVSFEVNSNIPIFWNFEGMNLDGAAGVMKSCGLSDEQVKAALSKAVVMGNSVQVHPDSDLIFSLSPEVRSKFYTQLGKFPSNFYMQWPFCYPRQSFETCMEGSGLSDSVIQTLRKLLYRRGDAYFFSDYELMLKLAETEEQRVKLAKALMRQPAVLVRLRIRPDTDIDKILGYWGRGGKAKDLRPLLESVERLGDGESISILYLLPTFARNRLYTFPYPSKESDPIMDCHWSTMNFFRDVPDNQFTNSAAVVTRLNSDFYRVGKPSLYGDVIILLDEEGKGIHSAVYLADDIVFTKNGNNFQMPWKLMRLSDLLAVYGTPSLSSRMQVYRNKRF